MLWHNEQYHGNVVPKCVCFRGELFWLYRECGGDVCVSGRTTATGEQFVIVHTWYVRMTVRRSR